MIYQCKFSSFPGLLGLPTRNGKLKDLSKFDAAFFGVSPKQADFMDPQLRLLLETAYECIVDAGAFLLFFFFFFFFFFF